MNKEITIKGQDLFNILAEAIRHGYKQYEYQEVGLEGFDPEGDANWMMKTVEKYAIKVENAQ